MFSGPFLLLTLKTKNHIVDKAFTGSSAGASAPGSGPGSRWFKSTLPENAKGTVSTVPFCIFRGQSGFETEHQQKPSVRRVLQRRWPGAGLPGGGGQIHSARNLPKRLDFCPFCLFLKVQRTFYFHFHAFGDENGIFYARIPQFETTLQPPSNHVSSYPWVEKTENELKMRIRCTRLFRT